MIVGEAVRRLRPVSEGTPEPLVIEFRPSARADSKAVLRIRATWQMDAAPPTELVIALTGQAHLDGEPTHGEAAVRAQQVQAARDAAQAKAARDAAAARFIARDAKIARPYPHQGQEATLATIFEDAKVALDKVAREQERAIDTARGEVNAFSREGMAAPRSAALDLALRALNLTAVGLAGLVAGELKRALRPGGRSAKTLSPPEAVVTWVAEAVKAIFKDAAKDYLGDLAATAPEVTDHKEEAVYVFAEQQRVLSAVHFDRGEALVTAHAEQRARLRTDGQAAIRAMTALRDALRALASDAYRLQLIQSRMAWMSTLSQDALGIVTSPAGAVTDIGAANDFPTEQGPVPPIEGVVDVEFVADFNAASPPIVVRAIRSSGVTPKSLHETAYGNGWRLRGLPVVVRATGRAEGQAVLRVCVTQDEAGRLTFRDETTAVGSGTWLSRHAGSWGAAAQQTGARKIMDEVLDADLERIPVTTDHEVKARR